MYSMFLWLIFRLSQQILRVILGGSMLHVIITVRICIHTSIAFQSVFSRLTPKAMEESSSWMMMMMKMIIMMLQFLLTIVLPPLLQQWPAATSPKR